MQSISSRSSRIMWRFAAFATVFLAGLVASPWIAIYGDAFLPRIFQNWLFFWPQVSLILYGLTMPASDMTRTFLDGGPNFAIATGFWALVGLALAWRLREKRVLVTALATLPISFAVAWILLLLLRAVGVGVYLEGF